ncbi:hypothetical protein QSH57_003234 [Fusarium oxysporum f. sp. vasinfectum]|nr:hypothetical protein QSH57_003234 [Fusarium oxysporum f. sp. vasinfectum]
MHISCECSRGLSPRIHSSDRVKAITCKLQLQLMQLLNPITEMVPKHLKSAIIFAITWTPRLSSSHREILFDNAQQLFNSAINSLHR